MSVDRAARAVDEWVEAGNAALLGIFGCSALVLTSEQCTGPQARMSDETLPMQVMGCAHPLWHQRFDGQCAQLGPRITEQMLGLRIGQDNAALGVGNNHRIRRHLEERLERGGMQGGAIVHARQPRSTRTAKM